MLRIAKWPAASVEVLYGGWEAPSFCSTKSALLRGPPVVAFRTLPSIVHNFSGRVPDESCAGMEPTSSDCCPLSPMRIIKNKAEEQMMVRNISFLPYRKGITPS